MPFLAQRDEHLQELMDDLNCDPKRLDATFRRFDWSTGPSPGGTPSTAHTSGRSCRAPDGAHACWTLGQAAATC
ncbi:hypothetical protein [Nesterenkonia pannonica]|uniref:hypothetical protein n=1 Tax=Nesterenkonia pannonica TaxID=1548602 RepID=UPI002164A1E7|nr:hypothetical protein [Nesterenkonia pannonica]